MTVNRNFRGTASEFLARALRGPTRRLSRVLVPVVTALALGGLALVVSFNAHASTPPAGPLRGTLDTQAGTAAARPTAAPSDDQQLRMTP
jgi:hypothetical protein